MKANPQLANRTKNISSSAIREIFKALKDPSLISLAGGSPASEYFPLSLWEQMIGTCHKKYGAKLYQYGITEGFDPLRTVIAHRYSQSHIPVDADEVVITTGAQSAIELVATTFLDVNDSVIVESPTFLASLKTFGLFEPKIYSIEVEKDGINIESLEAMLQKNQHIKFLYCIPNFQNPTGSTISLEKRKALAALLKKYPFYLIEDDPYGELRYEGEHLPTIHSLCPEKVIYIGSLSKIFSPGMRLGYFIAPPDIKNIMIATKQAKDVHTNTLAQALAAEFLASSEFVKYEKKMKQEYSHRLHILIGALKENIPSNFSWTHPEGGMFVWVTGPQGFSATEMYRESINQGVAYVPGTFFFTEKDTHNNTFRLNFTGASTKDIVTGIQRIAKLCKSYS